MNDSHRETINRILDYMRLNFSRSLSLADIARHAGYSNSWLRVVFKDMTGESIIAHLTKLRIQRAKSLLEETRLSVAEIAYEVGYDDYAYFARVFKKKTGLDATTYRSLAKTKEGDLFGRQSDKETREKREFFCYDFAADTIGSCWEAICGKWTQAGGTITGKGDVDLRLVFADPLPENFRIRLEARVLGNPQRIASDMVLRLADNANTSYCEFVLGAHGNTMGELRHLGTCKLWSEAALVKDGVWQEIDLELMDDTLRLYVDGKQVFQFRDPFPPPYSWRCRFGIGCWQSNIEFRHFAIDDLGFSPLVRPVRMGDSLFNSGLYENAGDFYMRLLESRAQLSDLTELRAKIGICFLKRGCYIQAQSWFDKVVGAPEKDFWARQTQAMLLEAAWKQENLGEFITKMKSLHLVPVLRDDVREMTARMAVDLGEQRGFYENRFELLREWMELEKNDSFHYRTVRFQLAGTLQAMGRFGEAEDLFWEIMNAPKLPDSLFQNVALALCETLTSQAKIGASNSLAERVRSRISTHDVLARLELILCWNLLAKGSTGQALRGFEDIADKFGKTAKNICTFALLQKVLLLCSNGESHEAWETMGDLVKINPSHPYLRHGERSTWYYPLHFASGDPAKAAECLLEDARMEGPRVVLHAEQMTKAGIMLELSGNAGEGAKIFSEVIRRFPPTRCNYYSALAEALLMSAPSAAGPIANREGERVRNEVFAQNPFHPQIRTEMSFLAGLLFESRGDSVRSRSLFELALKDDPVCRWPGQMAKKKLDNR